VLGWAEKPRDGISVTSQQASVGFSNDENMLKHLKRTFRAQWYVGTTKNQSKEAHENIETVPTA
jgi:hypothetical protein